MADAWITLAGVLAGGSIGIASNFLIESYRTDIRSEQIAHAIAGEILAVFDILSKRGHEEGLRNAHTDALAGCPWAYSFRVKRFKLATIEAHMNAIGSLPGRLPLEIPKFHVLVNSFLEDIELVEELNISQFSAAQVAAAYGEAISIMEEAKKTGTNIVLAVTALYGSPGLRRPSAWTKLRLFLRNIDSGPGLH